MEPKHDTDAAILHADNGMDLHLRVRAEFVKRGGSLSRWCAENSVCRPYAERCLKGQHNGPKSKKIVERILAEAGVIR